MTLKEQQILLGAMSSLRASINEWKYYIKDDYINDSTGINYALSALQELKNLMSKPKKKIIKKKAV